MADETTEGTSGRDAASSAGLTPGGNSPLPAGAPSRGAPAPLPTPPVATPAQTPHVPQPAQADQKMGSDIAKILGEVKLPERRETELGAERQQKKEVKDIDALLSGAAASSVPQAPAAPSSPEGTAAPAAQPAEKTSVQSLHTLKQDLQHVVQEQKISLVRAAALEEDRRAAPLEVEPMRIQARWGTAKHIVFASALLLVLGAAAFAGVYIVMLDRTETLPAPVSDSLVFAERTLTLPLDDQSSAQLKLMLESARSASTASLGAITRIVPTLAGEGGVARAATLGEFFSAVGARPPEQLMRALSGEFFFGLHTIDKNAPLLVIPVVSYDNAFAGMLAWEATMNADLAPAYVPVSPLVPSATGIPERRAFEDGVMRNYDVRQLKDDSGTIVLYYAFPTRTMLVIAESPYTFTEVLARLQAQRNL